MADKAQADAATSPPAAMRSVSHVSTVWGTCSINNTTLAEGLPERDQPFTDSL